MRLEAHEASSASVGYGEPGTRGLLGFADLFVSVQNRHYPHAIGAHPPSELVYVLPDGMQSVSVYAALNDTSDAGAVADFLIYADNELIAAAHSVRPHESPRLMEAELYGAKSLRFVITSPYWPGCHAMWLEPTIDHKVTTSITGVLGGVQLLLNDNQEPCDVCLVLVVTSGYESMAEAMLGSLWESGNCRAMSLLLIAEAGDTQCQHLATKFNARIAYVTRNDKQSYLIKSAAYSAARLIRAQYYIIADVDMIVVSSLEPVLATMRAIPSGHMLICQEQDGTNHSNFALGVEANAHPYFGAVGDLAKLKVSYASAEHCPILNGGFMAGTREAWLGLENAMRDLMPFAAYWERAEAFTPNGIKVRWREQGVMNAALVRTGRWSELSGAFNCQLAISNNAVKFDNGVPLATINEIPAVIVHFNGIVGRELYKQVSQHYRDGSIKSFGFHSESTTSESLTLGAKLFRACYQNTAALAFPTVDSYWCHVEPWAKLWSLVAALPPSSRVLNVNTFAMSTAAILLRATESIQGAFTCVSKNSPPDWFTKLIGSRLRTGDVELLMNDMVDGKEAYDFVCIDTSNNARMLCNLLNLTDKLLKPNGMILIVDIRHPANDISVILEKMHAMNFVDKLLYTSPNISLYGATRDAK